MKSLVLLNILCLHFCLSIFNSKDLQMVVDVIKSYDKPTAVVAKVCWKSANKVQLATMLANLERPTNIRFLKANETVKRSKPNNHIFFLIDNNCEDIQLFLNQANIIRIFSKSYRWLILGKPTLDSDVVASEFKNLSISVDSEVIVAQEEENKDILLSMIYKIKPTSEWNIEYFGTWSLVFGLNKSDDQKRSHVMRRKNFKGEFIASSTVITDNKTKNDLLGLSNILIDTPTKSSYRNILPLYDFLNATKQLHFVNTWGYITNGTWNGMIGDLELEKVDLCGTVVFMTSKRLDVLEYFTHPAPTDVTFVFRQPPLSYQNNLFVLPFTSSVWYCTGAFVIILTIILYVNVKWDNVKHIQYNEQIMDQSCLPPTLSDISIFVLSAISQQGSSNELKGSLGRLVMFIVFLTFLFLYTSYAANIVVLLQSTSNQIRTLSDLLNSKLELGIEDTPYNRYYFSAAYTAGDPIKRAIYEKKVEPKGAQAFMSVEDGVKRLQTEPFAFNMNTGAGYRVISAFFQEHEKCRLRHINFIPNSKAFLCSRKNSPYAEMFKVGYIRNQEHGLCDREQRLVNAKKPVCAVMGGSFGSVNMVDFYPVLLTLLYGMILAFVLLFVEILVYRRQKQNNSNRNNMPTFEYSLE